MIDKWMLLAMLTMVAAMGVAMWLIEEVLG
jgi:hypothetical protein